RSVERLQAAVVEKACLLNQVERRPAERPGRRTVSERALACGLRQIGDGLIEETLFFFGAQARGRLMDPAMHADFVTPTLLDRVEHLGVQHRIDGSDEKGR